MVFSPRPFPSFLHRGFTHDLVLAAEAKKVSQPWPTPAANAAAKDKYARTLFHLAQMFAELEDATMGAYYCGETLALQLEMGRVSSAPLLFSPPQHCKTSLWPYLSKQFLSLGIKTL